MSFNNQLSAAEKTQISRYQISGLLMNISTREFLYSILIIAILLRIASALYQGNSVTDLPGIYDQISYDSLARRVLGGYGFSFAEGWWPATPAGEPTAHWSYLYTLYLTAVYAFFGSQPLVARLIQAVIAGVLHPWLAWRIGRRIFGPTVGLLAAGLSAGYIYFFYYAGGLLTETFYIVGILWTLDVALRLPETMKHLGAGLTSRAMVWWLWLELGLAIGVTTLLRQVFVLFVPLLFVWLWWNTHKRRWTTSDGQRVLDRSGWPVLRGMILAVSVVLLMIIPWTVRNYRAFGTFVPLNTNAGYAFFWSNHPIYGTKFVGLLPSGAQGYYDLIPTELRQLNEAEMDKALLKRGIGFVVDDPIRFFLLSLSKTREYFKFWPSSQSGLFSNIARVGSIGLCLPFILYGLWVSANLMRNSPNRDQRASILLLYLFIVSYTIVHLLSWALVRYRLPVDAVLLFFAALGIEQLAKRFSIFSQSEIASIKH